MSKGLQPTTTNPNLLVYPHVVLSEQKQWNTMSMGGFGYRGWGGMGGMATTTEQNIPIGTLIVDLVDPNSKEMVWRGTAHGPGFERGRGPGVDQQGGSEDLRELPAGPGSK